MTPRVLTDPPRPGTPEWLAQITASKVPPMMKDPTTGNYLGLGYQSARSLYDQMTGGPTPEYDEETLDMFARGHAMESYAATRWLDENPGYTLAEPHPNGHGGYTSEVAYIDDNIPGCTVPVIASCDNIATHEDGHQVVLECKSPQRSTPLQQGWRVQHNTQMAVSGIHTGYVLIFPQYGQPSIIRHDFEPALWHLTIQCINDFAARLRWKQPPAETDPDRTLEALQTEHPDYAGTIALDPDQYEDAINAWTDAYKAKIDAETAYKSASATLAELMGDHQTMTYAGISIAHRTAGQFSKKRYPNPDVLKLPEVQSPKVDNAKLRAHDPVAYEQAIGTPGYVFTPANLTK